MPATIIDANWLAENRNPKSTQSLIEHGLDYTGRSVGATRELQTIQKTVKVANHVLHDLGRETAPVMRELSTNLGIGVSALNVARLPSATSDAIKSLSALTKTDDVTFGRKVLKAVRDTGDAGAAYAYAAMFIKGALPVIGTVAQVVDMVGDLADTKLSWNDYCESSRLESIAKGEGKVAATHSREYYFLRVVKAVMSVANTFFAVLAIATGFQLLPVLALLISSLFNVLVAIKRDIHKESGEFKVISFDKEVRLAPEFA